MRLSGEGGDEDVSFVDEMDNFFDGLPMQLVVPRGWKGG